MKKKTPPRLSMKLLWRFALNHGEVWEKYQREPEVKGQQKASAVPHFLTYVEKQMARSASVAPK